MPRGQNMILAAILPSDVVKTLTAKSSVSTFLYKLFCVACILRLVA